MIKKIIGWVDLQVNGFKGTDFSSPELSLDDIKMVSEELLTLGTIGYYPTIISCPLNVYKRNLPLIADAMKYKQGAQILGIHIEGPFINPLEGFRGIHDESSILPPSIELFDNFMKWSKNTISIISIAPELPGSISLIKHIIKNYSTIISIAHSNATKQVFDEAIKNGVTCVTHIGNGIQEYIHRHNNPIWTALSRNELYGLFITDGFHLPEDLIRVSLRSKGISKFIVTSDLVHLAGVSQGEYLMYGKEVVLESNGFLRMKGESYLAGSTKSMLECVNHLFSLGEIDINGIYHVGYRNALDLLHIEIDPNRKKIAPKIFFQDGTFLIKN